MSRLFINLRTNIPLYWEWIVNVGDEHALAQIVEHDDAGGPAQSAFVQLGPDA